MSRRFTVTALPRHGPAPARGPDRASGSDRLPGRDGRGERPGTAGGVAWGRVSGARSVGRVRGGGGCGAEPVDQGLWAGQGL